jgi:hypothetical protein
MAIGSLVIGPPGGGVIHRLATAAARSELAVLYRARRLRNRLR